MTRDECGGGDVVVAGRVRVVEVGYRRRGSMSMLYVKVEKATKAWGTEYEEKWGLAAAGYLVNRFMRMGERELARLANSLPVELENPKAVEAAQQLIPRIAEALDAQPVLEPAPRTIIEVKA